MFEKEILVNARLTPIYFVTDFRITTCNTEAAKLLGYSSQNELLERSIWDLYPIKQIDGKESKSKIQSLILEAVSGKNVKVQWLHKKKTGELIDGTIELFSTAKGNTITFLLNDQSYKPHILQLLKTKQQEYETLLGFIKGVVLKIDPKTTNPVFCSKNIKNLLGYSSDEWMSTPNLWKENITTKDKENVISKIQEGIDNFSDMVITYQIHDKSGNLNWVEHHQRWEHERTRPRNLYWILYDISKSKILENILLEKENTYRQIIENFQLGIFKIRKDGEVILANKPFITMMGFSSPLEMKDKDLYKILSGDLGKDGLFNLLSKNEVVDYYLHQGADPETETTLHVRVKACPNPSGDVKSIEGIVEYYNERNKASQFRINKQKQNTLCVME